MDRDLIFGYYKERYQPCDIVIAVAGNIKHENVVDLVEKALARADFLSTPASLPNLRVNEPTMASGTGKVGLIERKTEQAHLLLGLPGVERSDERRFSLSVLASALGGGMSSRLFQEIREKRGLAYSVYSYVQQFSGAGSFSFYAGCAPKKAGEVIKIIRDISLDVATNGLTEEEIARAKGAVSGSLVLSQEDTGSRMSRIGKSELVYGEIMSFDEILASIARVTPEEIKAIAAQLLPAPSTLAVVGPFKSTTALEKAIL
jgi:predicted Zn-dependent peptidase